jgi:hypothetical protein
MEHPQHHQLGAIESVLENVVAPKNLQVKLPVLFSSGNWAAEPGMSSENLSSRNDRVGDNRRQLRRLRLEERREPIKVGESVVRPVQLY